MLETEAARTATTLAAIVEIAAHTMLEVSGDAIAGTVAGTQLNLPALYDLGAMRLQSKLSTEGAIS